MKNINEYIVYRHQVCKIINIKDTNYVLEPISDNTITMQVPWDSPILRDLITKEEIDHLLDVIPEIDIINNNDKTIENEYKELMRRGTHEDLVKVIKTTYLRNEARKVNNKKASERDNEYFLRAEQYLYEELGIVLGMDFDKTKEYVIDRALKKQANQQ